MLMHDSLFFTDRLRLMLVVPILQECFSSWVSYPAFELRLQNILQRLQVVTSWRKNFSSDKYFEVVIDLNKLHQPSDGIPVSLLSTLEIITSMPSEESPQYMSRDP